MADVKRSISNLTNSWLYTWNYYLYYEYTNHNKLKHYPLKMWFFPICCFFGPCRKTVPPGSPILRKVALAKTQPHSVQRWDGAARRIRAVIFRFLPELELELELKNVEKNTFIPNPDSDPAPITAVKIMFFCQSWNWNLN